MTGVRVAQPIETLHGHGTALACDREGRILAEEQHGLFAGDTRVLSTYRTSIGGQPWRPLGRWREGHGTAVWRFENPTLRGAASDLPASTVLLEVRRRVAGALHDDLTIRAFPTEPVRVAFTLHLDADFADLFEVRSGSVPSRPHVGRAPSPDGIVLRYARGGFERGTAIRVRSDTPPRVAGALLVFELRLEHGTVWHACLDVQPELDGAPIEFVGDPHEPERAPAASSSFSVHGLPVLERTVERAREDLASLALPQPDTEPLVAGGSPWFLTLFGRDPLVTGLMSGALGAWVGVGALQALGRLQATDRDDRRDAEPGKLPHELRRGELARFDLVPHSPYYGTHDAPALYCLALWNAWRWTGDDRLLERHLPTARRALRWCDELGDRDGDGLLEYGTRSPQGYRNQGWKDAGDAIVHEDGRLADPPVATVELQGYLYAARLAMAELLEHVGDHGAGDLRAQATALRELVEERYWLDDLGSYALALDRDKRPVRSVTSNPGHLLWTGLPDAERARAVADRLLAEDLFTGWGLRTLSAEHPVYDPLSYQRGSVWPHDSAIAAAGMARYGLHEGAWTVARAVLDAAEAFEDDRLPELFCGFDRSEGGPVPYREANVPQAWAAAAPVLLLQTLLGIVPDAPNDRCWLNPRLPHDVPSLDVRALAVGSRTIDVHVRPNGNGTAFEVSPRPGFEVLSGRPPAPLWGAPIA